MVETGLRRLIERPESGMNPTELGVLVQRLQRGDLPIAHEFHDEAITRASRCDGVNDALENLKLIDSLLPDDAGPWYWQSAPLARAVTAATFQIGALELGRRVKPRSVELVKMYHRPHAEVLNHTDGIRRYAAKTDNPEEPMSRVWRRSVNTCVALGVIENPEDADKLGIPEVLPTTLLGFRARKAREFVVPVFGEEALKAKFVLRGPVECATQCEERQYDNDGDGEPLIHTPTLSVVLSQ